jgi:predicted PurR-regulated permease PerM
MMGAAVVTVVAIAIMLLAAVFVAALRLLAAVRQLTAALNGTRQQLEPVMAELRDNSEIAGLEAAQLQSSIAALGDRRNGQR